MPTRCCGQRVGHPARKRSGARAQAERKAAPPRGFGRNRARKSPPVPPQKTRASVARGKTPGCQFAALARESVANGDHQGLDRPSAARVLP